ncbi:hypothetical protein ANN_05024 [Periplaneta americana]|uniref:RNA-directed DNA polymerase from transposon X-element n=1 Tax=Periplaneta americana TaxID=6978 RepID=A0ABQ8TBL8_PERAM|nr:hypothetical protein ANN_05024 [Periplaneta americana]
MNWRRQVNMDMLRTAGVTTETSVHPCMVLMACSKTGVSFVLEEGSLSPREAIKYHLHLVGTLDRSSKSPRNGIRQRLGKLAAAAGLHPSTNGAPPPTPARALQHHGPKSLTTYLVCFITLRECSLECESLTCVITQGVHDASRRQVKASNVMTLCFERRRSPSACLRRPFRDAESVTGAARAMWPSQLTLQRIRATRTQGTRAVSQDRTWADRSSCLSLSNKRLIYVMLLKPIWLYGCSLWGSASISQIKRIQTFQNRALRIITGAPWYIRNETLHSDLDLAKVETVLHSSYTRLYATLSTHSNSLINQIPRNLPPARPDRRLKRKRHTDLLIL